MLPLWSKMRQFELFAEPVNQKSKASIGRCQKGPFHNFLLKTSDVDVDYMWKFSDGYGALEKNILERSHATLIPLIVSFKRSDQCLEAISALSYHCCTQGHESA